MARNFSVAVRLIAFVDVGRVRLVARGGVAGRGRLVHDVSLCLPADAAQRLAYMHGAVAMSMAVLRCHYSLYLDDSIHALYGGC